MIKEVAKYKSEIMNGFRFCQKVYESGIDSYEQFDVFTNLCENHVNRCNFLCKKIKPLLGILQYKKYCIYKDFRYTCAYTVSILNNILANVQAEYDKLKEISELQEQLEIKTRLEFELAAEYKDVDFKRQVDKVKSKKIGFNSEEEIDNL